MAPTILAASISWVAAAHSEGEVSTPWICGAKLPPLKVAESASRVTVSKSQPWMKSVSSSCHRW
jgi:hypothetical protein